MLANIGKGYCLLVIANTLVFTVEKGLLRVSNKSCTIPPIREMYFPDWLVQ
jgi:hypothetical protein